MKTITLGTTTYTCPFSDLLRPLTDRERADLRADIELRGVVVPVVVDEQLAVLDGHNRLEIAAELGLAEVPIDIHPGLTDEEKRDLAMSLNLKRRHLTAEE